MSKSLTPEALHAPLLAIAREVFGVDAVDDVIVAAVLDDEDQPALEVRTLLKPGKTDRLDGARGSAMLARANDLLETAGDPRFFYTAYATRESLAKAMGSHA